MAKYYGKIGFAILTENAPGVWEEQITERYYYGDVNRVSRRWQNGMGMNDDIIINNEISVISDEFATSNLGTMRYIEWLGTLWKIASFEIERPRIRITLGGKYNA